MEERSFPPGALTPGLCCGNYIPRAGNRRVERKEPGDSIPWCPCQERVLLWAHLRPRPPKLIFPPETCQKMGGELQEPFLMPRMMGRPREAAGGVQQLGSSRGVIPHPWLFNAAYCSPQFSLSLQDKCDQRSMSSPSPPQPRCSQGGVLLGGRIRLCRYNNSIHHRQAGPGERRFVNGSGRLAAQMPPISLTGNTRVPCSPRAAQPGQPQLWALCQQGLCCPMGRGWRGRLSLP